MADGSRYLEFGYDANGRMTTVYDHRRATDPNSPAVTYTYDAAGNLASATDLRGQTWTYQYTDILHPHHLTAVLDPLNHVVERQTYDTEGRVTEQRNGQDAIIVNLNYLDDRHVVVTDGRGNAQTYTYSGRGTFTGVELNYGGQAISTSLGHDQNYRPDQREDANGNPTTYTWSADGNTLSSATDANSVVTRYSYDAYGQRTQTVVNYVDGVYDPNTPDMDVRTVTAYDGLGRVVDRVDAEGLRATFGYDALGRLTSVIDNATGAPIVNDPASPDVNVQTLYTYDVLGKLRTITLPPTASPSRPTPRSTARSASPASSPTRTPWSSCAPATTALQGLPQPPVGGQVMVKPDYLLLPRRSMAEFQTVRSRRCFQFAPGPAFQNGCQGVHAAHPFQENRFVAVYQKRGRLLDLGIWPKPGRRSKMLLSAVITLEPQDDGARRTHIRQVQRWFKDAFEAADAALFAALHQANEARAYTLSDVFPPHDGGPARLRITSLDDRLSALLADRVLPDVQRAGEIVLDPRGGQARFAVGGLDLGLLSRPPFALSNVDFQSPATWAGRSDCGELVTAVMQQAADPSPTLSLYFPTPVPRSA